MRSIVACLRKESGEARPVSTARLKRFAAAAGLGRLAAAAGLGRLAAAAGLGRLAAATGLGRLAAATGLGTLAAATGLGALAAATGLGRLAAAAGLGRLAAATGLGRLAAAAGLGRLVAAAGLGRLVAATGLGRLAAAAGLGALAAATGLGRLAAATGLGRLAAAAGLGRLAAAAGLGALAAAAGLGRLAAAAGLGRLVAATGLGTLAAFAAPAAFAHAGERGFILLLPTGLFQAGGTIAVAVSFLVVIWIRAAALRLAFERARRALFAVPRSHFGFNVAASAVLVVLVAAGLAGSRDPLANPLPLSVWTLMWVGLTFAHAVLGYLWPIVNPWTAFARLLRRILGRTDDDTGMLDWPESLGAWPAVALLLLFAWFELVHPAPQDPAILAFAVAAYSVFTVAGMVLFGNEAWERNVEIFARFFRIVSWIAPLRTVEEGGTRRLALAIPGARLLRVDSLPAAGVVFVVVALATVSFDGLSRTFWWLDLAGENPLEHPGRTALVGRNTLGLAGAAAALLAAYVATAAAGARWSGSSVAAALRRFVVSIVPIAFGYHFAHYLPSFLVDAQYALKALSDPLDLGWNLLGTRDLHVTASFLTHHASVELVWYTQTAAIVLAHVAAVVVLHALAGESGDERSATIRAEIPLTALMIAYTLFGLWLLSTPVAA